MARRFYLSFAGDFYYHGKIQMTATGEQDQDDAQCLWAELQALIQEHHFEQQIAPFIDMTIDRAVSANARRVRIIELRRRLARLTSV